MQNRSTVIQDDEWKRIWAEKKSKQINNGPCAAVIVDCDCNRCLMIETDKERTRATLDAGA